MAAERIQYFNSYGYIYGMDLERFVSMNIPESIDQIDINDAIEFYEIRRFLEDEKWHVDCTEVQFNEYKQKSKSLFALTARFFNNMRDDSILSAFLKLERFYYESFCRLFDKFKLYKEISEDVFKTLIRECISDIPFLFEKIVEKYDTTLKDFLVENIGLTKTVMEMYNQNTAGNNRLYIPKSITKKDICSILCRYVESENPDVSVLTEIMNIKPQGVFTITDDIRLKAKRRRDEMIEELSSKSVMIKVGVEVSLSKDQSEEVVMTRSDGIIHASYSIDWLLSTLDYPSILNNFVYIFEYADPFQMRCQLVNNERYSTFWESLARRSNKSIYKHNRSFDQLNALAALQMRNYYDFLKDEGIHFENVLNWFYTKYLQQEFNCSPMRASFPEEEMSYSHKCTLACSALESVIKQFSLYARKREIDFELIRISSGSDKFETIPSLMKTKYIYGKGEQYKDIRYNLFSDQSSLRFNQKSNKNCNYKCFYDLMCHEDVRLSDYRESQQDTILRLCAENIVDIKDDDIVLPGNVQKLLVLKDLNDNGVINRWNYSREAYELFNEWVKKGLLVEDSCRLLSKQEADYFDFMLNNSEFSNGPALRNKYSHGNLDVVENEDYHKMNYMILLVLATVLTIKINDDFCIEEGLKQSEDA